MSEHCDYCGLPLARVPGGAGNVSSDGKPWCGCPARAATLPPDPVLDAKLTRVCQRHAPATPAPAVAQGASHAS